MNNVTFKVALPGEGKTKWLLNIAKHYADKGVKTYLFTQDDNEYVRFCDKYFKTFTQVCPVSKLTAFKITAQDVVLVDNLFDKCDSAISDFTFIQKNCYKMFITVDGSVQSDIE